MSLEVSPEQEWVIQAKEKRLLSFIRLLRSVWVLARKTGQYYNRFSFYRTQFTLAWFDLVPAKEGSSRTADCYELEANIFIPALFRSILGLFSDCKSQLLSFRGLVLSVSHSMNFKSVRWASSSSLCALTTLLSCVLEPLDQEKVNDTNLYHNVKKIKTPVNPEIVAKQVMIMMMWLLCIFSFRKTLNFFGKCSTQHVAIQTHVRVSSIYLCKWCHNG